MINKYLIKRNGVTLIELLIVLSLLVFVGSVGFTMLVFGNQAFSSGDAQYNIQARARLASDVISKQIRYAAEVELYDQVEVDEFIRRRDSTDITDDLNNDEYNGYKFIYIEDFNVKYSQVDYGGQTTTEVLRSLLPEIEFELFFTRLDNDLLAFEIAADNNEANRNFSINNEIKVLNIGLSETGGIVDKSNAVGVKFLTQRFYMESLVPLTYIFSQSKSGSNYIATLIIDRPDTTITPVFSGATVQNINDNTQTQYTISRSGNTPDECFIILSNTDVSESIIVKLKYLGNSGSGSNRWAILED